MNDEQLLDKVYEYGELFEDMRFKPGTATYKLTQVIVDGHLMGDSIPDKLEYFDYDKYSYKADLQSDVFEGMFYPAENVLSVRPDAKDSTILHEMIHLHETVINDLPMHYHDMIFWALYTDLRDKVPNLDKIITDNAHIVTQDNRYRAGGLHDLLFLLKSIDLDVRQGYPLGTVFGYGLKIDIERSNA